MSTQERTDARLPVLLVRKRAGIVGESQRTCHLVPMPEDGRPPLALTAYCGELIHRGEAELLTQPSGMPCVGCLFRVPMPRSGELHSSDWAV
ncbi:hypothetical protein Lesp02_16260 [Lentzea sp. NBRC 105346]|uniref:hypothetical protein n=1 Tax=Lentzea sp. NBRC 105346 TaxID=3032205 RepID=UPI0024A50EF5|nr:hypothetical protein [Lentzea sp. NBRC 105346]GLZ29436.1 hypothetical protein Lesp02_16260 [Lentzea sp. NBRC 105346]